MNRAPLWLLTLALLTGCGARLPPAPSLVAISPDQTLAALPTPVRITGGPFTPRVRAELDRPGQAEPLGAFLVSLVTAAVRVELTGVEWISSTELSAVVPAAIPGGTYRVEIRDPWGRSAALEAAFTVAQECLSAADCADELSCTQHACVAFRCEATFVPGFCLIEGACQVTGTAAPGAGCLRCDPAITPLGWSPAQDGTGCDDGDRCTSGETCTSQVCGAPTGTVSCLAQDACHLDGSCDPATGLCSTPAKANGTPCSDSDACTLGESCQAGVCAAPTAQVSCPGSDCREAGSCDPLTGLCQHADRTGSCEDGYDCTTADVCVAGRCRGSAVCADTDPQACLQLSTQGAVAPVTVRLDPGCTRDLETPNAALRARWDLDGDGSFEIPFEPLAARSQLFSTAGLFPLSVEVEDEAGNRHAASRYLAVAASTEAVVVTTPADEQDLAATPQAPGGTGLSLREAILHVNALGASRTIVFAAPMTVGCQNLPPLTAPGTRLAGGPGVRIDFSSAGTGSPCLTLGGAGQRVIGLELSGCPSTTLLFNASGGMVADSVLRDGTGDGVQFNGAASQLGPGVEVRGFGGVGVKVKKAGNTVRGVMIRDNGLGGVDVAASSSDTQVLQCRIWANGGSGLAVSQGSSGTRIWHNTLHGNAGDGAQASSQSNAVDLRNNLLTGNLEFGACGAISSFAQQNPNGVWGNAFGAYCVGSPDAGSVQADPGYLAPSRGDFRLRPGSPAINAGAPLPVDVNGPSDGGWFGPLPDLGAQESSQG
ncbi:MAG: right-handed parallel beta-helix repeat-containing protein [Myxococcota bacterium]|nr:right-handed parallel beta-helix repeat-containing protein [Myxococcota bacterium]